ESRPLHPDRTPVGVPATTGGGPPAVGAVALPGEPTEIGDELSLTYESGIEIQARSQWSYVRRRFIRHRLAFAGLILLILIFLAGAFAGVVAPHSFEGFDPNHSSTGPTWSGFHIF